MICYRDITFCTANCKTKCRRKLTEQVKDDARKWWGKEGAPIATTDFSKTCESYDKS